MATPSTPVQFDLQLIAEDMTAKGWTKRDLAKQAGIGHSTAVRFLKGGAAYPPTARKIARALGRPLRHYMLTRERVA